MTYFIAYSGFVRDGILGSSLFFSVFTCGLLLMATLLYIFKAGTVPWEYDNSALHCIAYSKNWSVFQGSFGVLSWLIFHDGA